MKKKIFFVFAATTVAIVTIVACKRNFDQKFDARGTTAGVTATCEQNVCGVTRSGTDTLRGVLTANKTLVNTKTYILDGKYYVSNNAQLTIPAGTLIKAMKKSTNDSASAIIVTRGAKINAEGTETCPIVFTSNQSVPVSGDWGGIVLLGKASINKPDTSIEGIQLPSVPAGVDIKYGGGGRGLGDDHDNSGILTYVRIEYAGAAIAPDNELNSLTCGGVGDGTILDHIQAYKGNDDAFEFFGGTVNAYYLYAYVPDDDAFDFDFGYRGHIQFAVSILNNVDDYSANPNGIECDNDGTGSGDLPYTRPVISNMTVLGVCDSIDSKRAGDVLLNGGHLRRNCRYVIRNSVFMGFPVGFYPQSAAGGQTLLDTVNYRYNLVHAFDIPLKMDPAPGTFTLSTVTTYRSNSANTSIKLADPCNYSCPDFTLQSTSPAVSGANFSGFPQADDDDFFDTSVGYRGAFDQTSVIGANWLQGWTKH